MSLPNIFIINVDQQRYDSLGFTGNRIVKTPNLDQLAGKGMSFTNAFTPIPLCCPARQSFLCGQTAETHGFLWNYQHDSWMSGLPPAPDHWPMKLKAAGYNTAYLGKWHVHPDQDPCAYGYDYYVPEEKYPLRRPQSDIWGSIEMIRGIGMYDEGDLETSYTHGLARDTIEQIQKFCGEKAPWHVRLDFMNPHLPCFPVKQFAAMYRPEDIPAWGSFSDEFNNKPFIQKQLLYSWGIEDWGWDMWSRFVAQYYAVISQYDDALGRVLAYLEKSGQLKNTIIIYTADHGDMCGSHRMIDKHFVLYEDIVHVPLVIRWDGVVKPGSLCRDFISNYLDLPPAICQMAELDIPEKYQGISLLPQLQGRKNTSVRDAITSTYNGNGKQFGLFTQRMIREHKYKFIWNCTDLDELYDLETDPHELQNLVQKKSLSNEIGRLQKKLYEELHKLGDPIVNGPWAKKVLLEGRKVT